MPYILPVAREQDVIQEINIHEYDPENSFIIWALQEYAKSQPDPKQSNSIRHTIHRLMQWKSFIQSLTHDDAEAKVIIESLDYILDSEYTESTKIYIGHMLPLLDTFRERLLTH